MVASFPGHRCENLIVFMLQYRWQRRGVEAVMNVTNTSLTTEADRQRLEATIRRRKRTDLCSEDHPVLAELVERADDELFDKVLINSGHVLYSILFFRRRNQRWLKVKQRKTTAVLTHGYDGQLPGGGGTRG